MVTMMGMDNGMVAKVEPYSQYASDDVCEDAMGAAWNPVVSVMQAAAAEVAGRAISRYAMPTAVAEVDVDDFLRKMYCSQQ